jgi:tetratricopeptide (TPR) repeat protein
MIRRLLYVLALISCPAVTQDPAPADAELRRAQALLAAGRLGDSIAVYRGLAHRFPRNAEVILNLTIAEYKAGRYSDAAAHAAAALLLEPRSFTPHLFLGASRLALGDAAGAVQPLSKAVDMQPNDRNAMVLLADALLGAARYADAAERYESVARILPDSPRVWYGLYRSYHALGQDRADLALARLNALSDSPEKHEAAATAHESQGRYRDAAAEWRRALDLHPENPPIRRRLVLALFQSNDHAAALPVAEAALARDPGSSEWNFLCGAALLNILETGRALAYLEKAVRLDPKMLPARAALGQALLQTGQAQAAIPHLEAALSGDTDGSGHYQLARAYQAAGRAEDATRAIRKYKAERATSAPQP